MCDYPQLRSTKLVFKRSQSSSLVIRENKENKEERDDTISIAILNVRTINDEDRLVELQEVL